MITFRFKYQIKKCVFHIIVNPFCSIKKQKNLNNTCIVRSIKHLFWHGGRGTVLGTMSGLKPMSLGHIRYNVVSSLVTVCPCQQFVLENCHGTSV